MKIMPPREIMKYVAFKNGEPVAKEEMPLEYYSLFNDYKTKFLTAKTTQKEELEKLKTNVRDVLKMRDIDILKILHDKIRKKEIIVDKEKYFILCFIEEINLWIMCCEVFWIAQYERYYFIDDGDIELYKNNRDVFLQKYSREINQDKTCFTERFMGSGALRDYDGANRFQDAFESEDGVNAFSHYGYLNGVLYAKIAWKDNTIYVPPVQAIQKSETEWKYPLRDKCELQTDVNGVPICYKYKF